MINTQTSKLIMKLNCDLGESFGAWQMTEDDKIMPFVDMASIACGFHAGDPVVIHNALKSAKNHNVQIGAHPSYPDLQGFGRRSMSLQPTELHALLHYQIAALDGMSRCQNVAISYIKPHGALYNDMMADMNILETVIQAVSAYYLSLPLVIQATPNWQSHQKLATKYGVCLMFEAFADRRYQDNGALVSRNQSGAVLDKLNIIAQVDQILSLGQVTTLSGNTIPIKADTLCVHGDNQAALEGVKAIRQRIVVG